MAPLRCMGLRFEDFGSVVNRSRDDKTTWGLGGWKSGMGGYERTVAGWRQQDGPEREGRARRDRQELDATSENSHSLPVHHF